MSLALKAHLIATFGLAAEADDAAVKAVAADKIKSGELGLDKYTELLTAKPAESGKDKAAELSRSIATETATAVATALGPALNGIAELLKARGETPPAGGAPTTENKGADEDDFKKIADEMEKRLIEKHGFNKPVGGDGAALMKMAYDEASEDGIRVKGIMERFQHTPKALCYGRAGERSKAHAQALGLDGRPMMHNGVEVNESTEKSRMISAAWVAFQTIPELLTENEKAIIRHALHKEKFFIPGSTDSRPRLLTEQERQDVWDGHMNFYRHGHAKAVINDSTSGGQYATPEYFDMDYIVTPTLASEAIPSYCHIIDVPRGTAAQGFTMGRPTVAAANTEGSAVSLFTTTGFIGNHDTTFYRAAGFTEVGINFAQDAHPGVVPEIFNQYMESHGLWLNEQICTGDGTTEPQGIMNASGTTNVTPTTPTTGPIVIADILEMMFGVGKAYRFKGNNLKNFCYIMTDTAYYRIRSIATGVTGDTRLIFGMDVNGYTLFNQPVLIEQGGMTNDFMIAAQLKGYRLYRRQSPRFIREDRGATLVRANTFLVGIDFRYGGQLDLGGYAAVATGFIP